MNGETLRYEYKYVIHARSAELLKHQLGALLRPDEHADSNGEYFIRSVYFDDGSYSAFYEKLAGGSVRNKYRLRFYNMDSGRIAFEAKRKCGQLVRKESLLVPLPTAERMMNCAALTAQEKQAPLLAEFDALSCGMGLKPRVIVDYTRAAFLYPVNNVRITLDSNICAESFHMDRVFRRLSSIPVAEHGEAVLEVKFSEWLPPFLAQALSGVPEILQANSKYCNCLAVYL